MQFWHIHFNDWDLSLIKKNLGKIYGNKKWNLKASSESENIDYSICKINETYKWQIESVKTERGQGDIHYAWLWKEVLY